MEIIYSAKLKYLAGLFLWVGIFALRAANPGDVIINEIYFDAKKGLGKSHFEAVELLVVADKLNLNGLQVSDRPIWNVPKNDQCTLQDLGHGFLSAVPSGTLIVIYDGNGTDDTNANDFTLSFYARSSLYCNVAPTGNAFSFRKPGKSLHLLYLNGQVDFLKYRASNATHNGPADPGKLGWENGVKGYIDVGMIGENVGFRFLGNKADLNDFPAAWMAYSEDYKKDNNLGKPNGGVNTVWIEALRAKASQAQTAVPK
ncbi:MAG: hypothetical protein H0X66_14120 [Verrucomicrobia bacterium]|nr:hypothetical protein [Verrucomicrobiota bacterium]